MLNKLLIPVSVIAVVFSNPAQAQRVEAKAFVTNYYGAAVDGEVVYSDASSPPFDPSVSANTSNSWATADLADGSLKGFADTRGTTDSAGFAASMSDIFHFSIDGASTDTITRIFMNVHFDAHADVYSGAELTTLFGSNQSTLKLTNAPGAATLLYGNSSGSGYYQEYLPIAVLGDSTVHATFDHLLAFDVLGATGTARFFAGVTGNNSQGGFINFGNSAHFNFVLPQGVSFTSDSGSALTGGGAVPEPATWAMMIIGFGMIGGAMRSAARKQKLTVTYA